MAAIIIGSPVNEVQGSTTPIDIPASGLTFPVLEFDNLITISQSESQISGQYWSRSSNNIFPSTTLDSVIIGGNSLVSTEKLRVVGDIYSNTLTLENNSIGVSIIGFSSDDTFANAGDDYSPTQLAVKTYVDTSILSDSFRHQQNTDTGSDSSIFTLSGKILIGGGVGEIYTSVNDLYFKDSLGNDVSLNSLLAAGNQPINKEFNIKSGIVTGTYSISPYDSKNDAIDALGSSDSTFFYGNDSASYTTRLTYDGYLYAKKLYSEETEVLTSYGPVSNHSDITSDGTDIEDAVTKRHAQNTDTGSDALEFSLVSLKIGSDSYIQESGSNLILKDATNPTGVSLSSLLTGADLTNGIMKFTITGSNLDYNPYIDKTGAGGASSGGKFFRGPQLPTNTSSTNRLNYDGYFYSSLLFSNGLPCLTTGTNGLWQVGTTGTSVNVIPYTSKSSSLIFYQHSDAPTGTSTLKLNGYFDATKLYISGTEVNNHASSSDNQDVFTIFKAVDSSDTDITNSPYSALSETSTITLKEGSGTTFSMDTNGVLTINSGGGASIPPYLTNEVDGASLYTADFQKDVELDLISETLTYLSGSIYFGTSSTSMNSFDMDLSTRMLVSISGTSLFEVNTSSTQIIVHGNGTPLIFYDGTDNQWIKTVSGEITFNDDYNSDITLSGLTSKSDCSSGILYWDSANQTYIPYATKSEVGVNAWLYNDSNDPDGIDDLKLNGRFYASRITGICTSGSAVEGYSTDGNAIYGNSTLLNGISVGGYSYFGRAILGSTSEGTAAYFNSVGTLTGDYSTSLINIIRSNTCGSFNITGDIIDITDNPTTVSGDISGKVMTVKIGSSERISLNPRVADGASAEAYIFDTNSTLSVSGSKLLEVRNNSTAKLTLYANGQLSLSSTIIGQGTLSATAGLNGIGVRGINTGAGGYGGYFESNAGVALYVKSTTGKGISVNNATGNTSNLMTLAVNSVSKAYVDKDGMIGLSNGIEIDRGDYIYHRQTLGIDTDGDVREYCDASGKYIERRESGIWVNKQTLLF